MYVQIHTLDTRSQFIRNSIKINKLNERERDEEREIERENTKQRKKNESLSKRILRNKHQIK